MDARERLLTICRNVHLRPSRQHVSVSSQYGTDAEQLEIKIMKKIIALMRMKED